MKFEGSTTSYCHRDHLSNRLLTNASGAVVAQSGHFPYGESWYATGSSSKWVFTTYQRDFNSGNDYAIARYYVCRLGRFTSPDPVAGTLTNPQSLDRYTYVGDDPINLVDPTGEWWACGGYYVLNVAIDANTGSVISVEVVGFICLFPINLPNDPPDNSAKAHLNPKDQARYDKLRSNAVNDIFNSECMQFLRDQGIDPVQFALTLATQQAYNGSQSTITQAAAQVGIPGRGVTVAEGFRNSPNVNAAGSLNGTDIYFRQNSAIASFIGLPNGNINEATIEHEGLHNYQGLYNDKDNRGDAALQHQLGLEIKSDTSNITEALKAHHCSH